MEKNLKNVKKCKQRDLNKNVINVYYIYGLGGLVAYQKCIPISVLTRLDVE